MHNKIPLYLAILAAGSAHAAPVTLFLGNTNGMCVAVTDARGLLPYGSGYMATGVTLTARQPGACNPGVAPPPPPPPPPVAGCPATISLANGVRTLKTFGTISYGVAPYPTRSASLLEWDNIWGHNSATSPVTPWPGVSGAAPVIRQFGRSSYIGAHFHTPLIPPVGMSGRFVNPTAIGGPNTTMAISTQCGDFSAHLPTPGCLADHQFGDPPGTGIPTADVPMVYWQFAGSPASCILQPNTDYYVNIIQTDPASNVECAAGSNVCPLSPWKN